MDLENENFTDSEDNLQLDKEYYEDCILKMEKDIRELWDNVIIPYRNDYNSNYLLDKLTNNDFDKFYEFMIYNNPTCIMLYENYKKFMNKNFKQKLYHELQFQHKEKLV
jgi:hypothetical protein